MDRPVTYRAAESSGDPALAPAFAAMFLGSAAVAVLAGVRYKSMIGDMGFAVAVGLGVLMMLVCLAICFLLKRNVLFATASAEDGLLIRWGYGGRARIKWDQVGRVLRTREAKDSPTATLNVLVLPRTRVVFPPGEGQDELYELCLSVLDKRKSKRRGGKKKTRETDAEQDEAEAWADINGIASLLWALFKVASLIVGGIAVVSAADAQDPTLTALFVAIAFVVVVPLSLFPPSAAGAVVRARASAAGLTYQSILYGTRTIRWERLAMARLYIPGQAGKLAMRFVELYDVDGGRLLIPRPRNPEFYHAIDQRLGTTLASGRTTDS